MNAKQKYLLLLLLCGFVTGHAMENPEHTRFSDEESSTNSEEENSIPTIDLHDQETLQDVNLSECNQIKNGETSNTSADNDSNFDLKSVKVDETSDASRDADKKDNPPVQPIRKYNPLSWATYLNDLRRGTLDNLIHELENNERFDEKAMSDNMPRVNYAIKEAITNNKADQLVLLVQKLNARKFPILQEKSEEVVTYLNKAVIQTQDKFVTETMSKIAQHKKFIQEKETEIINNVLPLLSVLLLEINKQAASITFDTNKTVETLNTYKNILDTLDTTRPLSDNYTAQNLLEKTKTTELIYTTLEKNENMKKQMVQVQKLLTNTIEKK